MDEHQKFLADRLLSDGSSVSYRALSRALNVHVNTAKGMLHEFYKYQNGVRPKSVTATYLILGQASATAQSTGDDTEMSSSMPESEGSDDISRARLMTLVNEEELSEALHLYQSVTSIHIYSLAPTSVKDYSHIANESKYPHEVASSGCEQQKISAKLGVIFNPHLRIRDFKGPPLPKMPAASKTSSKGILQDNQLKADAVETTSKEPLSLTKASGKHVARNFAGAIHKSFAKSSKKPSVTKSVGVEQDEALMALSSDGEADDSDIMPSTKAKPTESSTKSRKEREEDLRRMMEEDAKDNSADDESRDSSEKERALSDMNSEEQQLQGIDGQAESTAPAERELSEVVSSTGDGRRRGKRRVMKKKRILDDQGYMVTIQEPAWESFSEDETDQPQPKKLASAPATSASAPKGKKGPTKGAQGSIMSFFSKK